MDHQPVSMGYAREGAWLRQGGLCLACHQPVPWERFEAHHRQRRRAAGVHCRCNVVALHPRCHTAGPDAVHSSPAAATARGLIVSAEGDPRTVPVWTCWPWEGLVLLCCDGTLETAD